MRSGQLKNRIELQGIVRASDNMGGFTDTFLTLCTVFAAIWPVKMTESVGGSLPVAAVTHQIRIRYRNGVTPRTRIKFGTKYFNIVSIVNPNTDFKALDLMAKEVVA